MSPGTVRLLVVDDDLDALATYRRMLSLEGYDVATAPSGRCGLELLQAEVFRLVLIDLRLPDLSGLELLAEARVRVPDVPIIVYTAFGSAAPEFAARHIGAADNVDTLWTQESLLQTVARHLLPAATAPVAPSDAPVGPATRRWVSIVVAVTCSREDVPCEADWASLFGKSIPTLRRWCKDCGVNASDSLEFARALRIAWLCDTRACSMKTFCREVCNWYNMLDIAEPKTMQLFLQRAGFSKDGRVPPIREFVRVQRFITDPILMSAVLSALENI